MGGYKELTNEDLQNIQEPKLSNSVSVDEQEVCISMMRDEDFGIIYTSDTTYITKLNKLCASSPDMYVFLSDTGRGRTYRVNDKSLISFRAKKKEMSDEARSAASERFSQLHAEGKIGRKKKDSK